MMYISDRKLCFEYLQATAGLTWSEDFRGIMVVREEFRGQLAQKDHVAAAFGFNNFVGHTASFHQTIRDPRVIQRGLLKEVFNYAFKTCQLQALIGPIDSTNVRAISAAKKLGGRLVHTIPKGGLEGDLLVYQMLAHECVWIKEKIHG